MINIPEDQVPVHQIAKSIVEEMISATPTVCELLQPSKHSTEKMSPA
jgi:hypothetical protein